MAEEQPAENNKKQKKQLIAILVTISIIIAVTLTLPEYLTQSDAPTGYTTSFKTISPQDTQTLINTTSNLTIVDTRSCDCSYNKGHIQNAIWNKNPAQFYNTTNDLLIYCQDGATSTEFCENLVNHTYGEIYHLEGGISAWEEAGYKIIK